MHNDYDSLLHRQKHRHDDERGRERGRLQYDDIRCRHEWAPPRLDDLRHSPHAHGDERAFGRNDSVLGELKSDYTRGDLDYHDQMRDLHHATGGASGHYNNGGGKSEERGRE
jgi:hypothetical protein